jgi:tRNA threonylcarbamoyladenosine biosynthesis protein TsaB
MPPTILAIETSQRIGGVALSIGDVVDVEMLRVAPDRRHHDDDLVPAIDRVTRRHGLGARGLDAVGLSIGPGGFTGLRIAVSVAKMLAESVGAMLVAVPSALVAAHAAVGGCAEGELILVALAVKGDDFWRTRLRFGDDGWTTVERPGLVRSGEVDLDGVRCVVADEHLPEAAREACDRRSIPIVEPRFDPGVLVPLVRRALDRGETVDPLALAPLYPREPEAVTLWNRRELDAAKGRGDGSGDRSR